MKLLHISDLHLGKRVNGLSMIEEQEHIIDQLAAIAHDQKPAGVLIAGDIFDRPVASREALKACERLFQSFVDEGIAVFAIPGNHDSSQQLAFCSGLLASSGLHIARAFDGHIDKFLLDEDGVRVCIHLLPFVRPTDVRMALPDLAADIASHQDAVVAALGQDTLEKDALNILVAHQFVMSKGINPKTCDSELTSLGGADAVDAAVFDAYDYVALGHLHGAQHMGRKLVRYSGSPLKYSFSEAKQSKSATILEIGNGTIKSETCPLIPLHDMRELRSSYAMLQDPGYDSGSKLDYMRITLTDTSLFDAMAKLRVIYPHILRLDWDTYSPASSLASERIERIESDNPIDLFDRFYERQSGKKLGTKEREIVVSCIDEADGR